MAIFSASRFSGNDNSVFPDKIEINGDTITYFKGTLMGYHTTIIEKDRIASVQMRSGLIFADVIIESFGGRNIVAKGFKRSDARNIVEILRK